MAEPTEPKKWTRWHTPALLLIIVAIGVISELELDRRLTWFIVLVLLAAFATIAGQGVTGHRLGIVVDNRNKVSLSRLQMLIWTIIVASGFLSSALFNMHMDSVSSPLDITIPEQLLWLMGISTTSLVGSPLVKSGKKTEGKIHDNKSLKEAHWKDIFMGEEKDNAATIDLAKVQMFFFTLVVVLAYAISMGTALSGNAAITTLPELDGSIVGLLGISHAGYLTSKGVPKGKEKAGNESGGTGTAADQTGAS